MKKHTPTDDPRWEDLFTGGSLRRVTRWGEPVLHARTEPVTDFDTDLHDLIRDMFTTMDAADGVGLAATQVGLGIALFVYVCPDDDNVMHHGAVCNPVVTLPEGRDRRLVSSEEGCLSWPGGFSPLARPDHATCEGQDPWGNPLTVTGTGFFARCLQHEGRAHLYPDDWPIHPKG